MSRRRGTRGTFTVPVSLPRDMVHALFTKPILENKRTDCKAVNLNLKSFNLRLFSVVIMKIENYIEDNFLLSGQQFCNDVEEIALLKHGNNA